MKRNPDNVRYSNTSPYTPPESVTIFPVEPDRAYLGRPADEPVSRMSGCLPALARAARWGAVAAVVLAVFGCLLGFGGYFAIAATLPSADQLAAINVNQSTKIYDRNGGLLFEIFDPNSGRHTIVPPEQIPNVLQEATIATEDPTFYSNFGVDLRGVARAIYYDVRYQSPVVGGSTITQQLVKNAFLTPEVSIQRKIREAVLAIEVTRRYSKPQILAFYLNTIYYGNLSYGIEAASQSYFKKDVGQLDLAEASLLAGLPQAPSLYDPCENPDAALARQDVVLGLMEKQGYVTTDQKAAAESEMDATLHSDAFSQRCNAPTTMIAPHFVEYVRQLLEQQYGAEVLYKGGLQVHTTLDPTMQNIVEQEAQKQIAALQGNNVKSAAVVAANPQTGEIYAMLGSVNFFDKNIDGQVNVATSPRQPGSSIKPINYVTALEKGWTLATPLLDIRTEFPNGSQPPYVPTDYDGKEHGIVSVRTALANSLNIPAVKTLDYVGVKNMIATAQKMGITTFQDPNRYGLSLTLGGGEVKLVELTEAYAVFANRGQHVPLTPFRKIVDGQGNTLLDTEQTPPQPQKVLDPRYAYLITSVLSDNSARTMEFGPNSPLKLSRPAAAKTGTTNDFKDNWTMGYTPELVVGVWVGDPRNSAMKGVSGITGAAPIWHNVMERAYKEDDLFKNVAPHNFAIPGGLVQATVCNESGLLPTDTCPADHRHTEIFIAQQAPNKPDDLWVRLKIDKTNNLLADDQCPPDSVEERTFEKMPQDVVMPYDQVVAWANAHGIPQPPTDKSPCTNAPTPQPAPTQGLEVRIYSPQDGATISGVVNVNGTASVANFANFSVEVDSGDQRTQVGAGNSPVFPRGRLASFDSHSFADGDYTIRLVVTDQSGNQTQDAVQVTIQNQAPDTPTPRPTRTPAPQKSPPPPGKVVYQDNNPAVGYNGNWTLVTDPRASGGTFTRSPQTGATASLTVSGAGSFTITTIKAPGRGIANVLVDGQSVGTFDGYAPTVTYGVVVGPFSLPDAGQHTITIVVTGTNSPPSSGDVVVLDNFVVYPPPGGPSLPPPTDTPPP